MSWQDAVFATGQGLFAVSLVPALLSASKPPRVTCWTTGLTLLAFAGTFLTLELWLSCASSAMCGALWIWLGLQRRTTQSGKVRPPKPWPAPPWDTQ